MIELVTPHLPRVCLFGVVALVFSWVSLGLELAVSAVSVSIKHQSAFVFFRCYMLHCANENNKQPLERLALYFFLGHYNTAAQTINMHLFQVFAIKMNTCLTGCQVLHLFKIFLSWFVDLQWFLCFSWHVCHQAGKPVWRHKPRYGSESLTTGLVILQQDTDLFTLHGV